MKRRTAKEFEVHFARSQRHPVRMMIPPTPSLLGSKPSAVNTNPVGATLHAVSQEATPPAPKSSEAPAARPGAAGLKPNIVFILVDNVGWGDIGAYGGQIPTPRIDQLAREGIRFTNYTVEPQCTPSRAAILSGRLPVRRGTSRVPFPGEGQMGLSPWEYTIAELLSDSGYATALYGKWHVGNTPGRMPSDQGFDEWWGLLNSSDEAAYSKYPLAKEAGIPTPRVWEGYKGQASKPAGDFTMEAKRFMDEKIAELSVGYIKKHAARGKPFFVYTAFTHIHPPMMVHPDFAGTSKDRGGLFADMIGEMDHRVGQILDAIKASGIEDNTIVVFSSDNATGGVFGGGGGSNGPWRGNFFTPPFEGSYRVPAAIRWPGRIPADKVTNEMLGAVDWMPTLSGWSAIGKLDRSFLNFRVARQPESGPLTTQKRTSDPCVGTRRQSLHFQQETGLWHWGWMSKPPVVGGLPTFSARPQDPHTPANLPSDVRSRIIRVNCLASYHFLR